MSLLGAVLLALSLFGCGSDDPSLSNPPVSVDEIDLLAHEAQVESTDARSEFSELQAEFVAAEEAFADCVLKLGFEYKPRSASVSVPTSQYLPSRADRVREHGYGIVESVDGVYGMSVAIDGGTVPTEQAAAFRSQVIANPDSACNALYWQGDLQEALVERLEVQAQPPPNISSNPDYVRAEIAWSRCMANAGYPYGDRGEPSMDVFLRYEEIASSTPGEDLSSSIEIAELREFELDVARTDLECYAAHIDPLIARLLNQSE